MYDKNKSKPSYINDKTTILIEIAAYTLMTQANYKSKTGGCQELSSQQKVEDRHKRMTKPIPKIFGHFPRRIV